MGSPYIDYQLLFSDYCSISALSCSFEFCGGGCGVGVDGGIPSDYFDSTQLQLWLFFCWGCGCCWAVTIVIVHTQNIICNGVEKMSVVIHEKVFICF